MITISRPGMDLFGKILESVRRDVHGTFVVTVLYGILDRMLGECRSILSEIEFEVIRISESPRSKLPKDFLERICALNKEVSRLVSNLLHYKDLLAVIIANKVPLEGFDDRAEEDFHVLQDGSHISTRLRRT